MGLPINIEDLLHDRVVERDRIEYKEGWNPEPIMHTLCAFANDFHNVGGGYLFIGVAEEDGRPVLPPTGLTPHQLDDLQKKVVEIGHRIRPAYVPVIEPYLVDGKHVLVLWAPGGQTRPYKARSPSRRRTGHTTTISGSVRRPSPRETIWSTNSLDLRPPSHSTIACSIVPVSMISSYL